MLCYHIFADHQVVEMGWCLPFHWEATGSRAGFWHSPRTREVLGRMAFVQSKPWVKKPGGWRLPFHREATGRYAVNWHLPRTREVLARI